MDYDVAACYSITFESERGFSRAARAVNVADAVNIVKSGAEVRGPRAE